MPAGQILEFVDQVVASEALTQQARATLEGAVDASAFCALAKRSGFEFEPAAVEDTLRSELASSMSCLASGKAEASSVITMLQRLELDVPPSWLRLPSVQFDTGSLCS